MQSKRQFLPPFSEQLEQSQQPVSSREDEYISSYSHPVPPPHPQTDPHFRLPSISKLEALPPLPQQGVIPPLPRQFIMPPRSRHEALPPLPRQSKAGAAILPAHRPEALPPLPRHIEVGTETFAAPRREAVFQPPARRKRTQRGLKQKRKRRVRPLARLAAVMMVLVLAASLLFAQGNGAAGAWFADTFRAVLGPAATAQIESWYLTLTDEFHQAQYQLSGKQVAAPWKGTPVVAAKPPEITLHGTEKFTPIPMLVSNISPFFSSTISGAGIWTTISAAPAPYTYMPLAVRTFVQPDATHPYAVVTLLQFDGRFIRLHMVAGTAEPGGPRGVAGPGAIPAADQAGNALLAAFNGGFKYADGQYGMMANGVVYVPPQSGAATIAVTKAGQIIIGAWGVDPRLNSSNANLVAWRQNASLLINNGMINPLTQDGSAWGATILNSSYTWRSGIGVTAQGTLIYAGGNSLTAYTLAVALKAAGAVYAMQTDINPYWVRAFTYNRSSSGSLSISKLNPSMQGTGTEYLYGTQRDFFYLTRFTPSLAALYPMGG